MPHIMPGHPVYERIRAEVEAERLKIANDPATIQQVRDSIDRKIDAVRRQVEWEKAQARGDAALGPPSQPPA